ncbi:hypothetical protein DFH27DRAFT_608259 [Peziza echinospora]|nr:hypothetical protein DFH27DRAFT_608259 [Peziza echinospora]
MSAIPARKPNPGRRSIHSPAPPNRSPTPSRDTTSIPVANGSTAIGRRHTIREGPNGAPFANGHVPNGSISSLRNGISARSAVKRPSVSGGLDDGELEKDLIIADLRQKVSKLESTAETAAVEFAESMKAMQKRTEEAIEEAAKLEELLHSKDDQLEDLEIQVKDLQRGKRDRASIHDAERLAWSQEKEDMVEKEEELNATIQRLKEALAQSQRERSIDETSSGRRSSGESQAEDVMQFAPPSQSSTPPPRNPNNNILLQKDKIIQQLRLELAEYQIRVAEADHMGGSKVHELEQRLMEVRMANARLMEDNESFQLLLSTATLNGDFSRGDFMTNAFSDGPHASSSKENDDEDGQRINRSPVSSSLADELEDVEENETHEEAENQRKLEAELKSLKDQNKAMSLYINNIIERLLQHKDFEAILDKTPSLGSIQASQAKEESEKSSKAPPPPPAADKPATVNLLNRTRSIASQGLVGGRTLNKPMPAIPSAEQEPTPLQRSQSMRVTPSGLRHKRSQSDTGGAYANGANLVNTMLPKAPPRASTFFSSGATSGDSYTARPARSRNSVASSLSVASSISDGSNDAPLPSPTLGGGPIGMIAGNKLRPLRLVQENTGGSKSPISPADDKTNKRASWMGWFNRGKEEEAPTSNIVFERKDIE